MKKTQATVVTESMPLSVAPTIAVSSTESTVNEEVRVLDKREYKAAARCLAESFEHDDVATYFVRTGDRKGWSEDQYWKLHVHIFECLVLAHIRKGKVTAIGPNYDCVAMWMPPGCDFDDLFTMLRSRLYFLHFKLSKEGRGRFFTEFLPLLHATKHRVLRENDNNSYYLVYIGTKPDSRKRGYAKALIEHTTKQADLENRITYLESSNPKNIKFYNRLGFNVVDQALLRRGTNPVQMDIMTRLPLTMTKSRNDSYEDGESEIVKK